MGAGAPNGEVPGARRGVAMLALSETVAWGVLYYSFGVLLRPFASHLAVSEAVVAGAFSVALLCAGAGAWVAGAAIDRWGPRPVMTAGAVVAAVALASLGSVGTLAGFYAAWAAIGLSHAAVLYEPAFTAIAKWFPAPRSRARAFLVVTTAAGFASTLFVPLAATLHQHFGRQRTVLCLAALVAVVVVPLNAALPRQHAPALPRPDDATLGTSGQGPAPRLVVLATVFSLQAFASAGVAVHLVSHLREGGADLVSAARITGLMGAAQVGARLLVGFFHRAVRSRVRLPLLLGLQAAALVGVLARADAVVTLAVVLLGAANGLVTLERATVIAEVYGAENYGAVSGRIATFANVTRAGAPVAVGLVQSAASYAAAFVALAALTAAAAMLVWTARGDDDPRRGLAIARR